MRAHTGALTALLFLTACSGEAEDAPRTETDQAIEATTTADGSRLGTVVLAHACSEEAQIDLERGLALLHSMTYEEAAAGFESATDADPECAMGYWGQAMTIVHPLWSDPPSEAEFERGAELLATARETAATDHELAYVNALAPYFEAGRTDSEKPNLAAFEEGVALTRRCAFSGWGLDA